MRNNVAFSAAPDAGGEQAPCRAGNQCDEGLVCLSNLCVNNSAAGGATTTSEGGGSSTGAVAVGGNAGGRNEGAAGDRDAGGGATMGGSATGEAGSGSEGGAGGSPVVDCAATTPYVLAEPTRRGCAAGMCYCAFGACFPSATAGACCEQAPICPDNSASAEVDCSGKHPVIGPPRTCEPGYCLCSKAQVIDVCLPAETAPYCCPPGVPLSCVPG